jgi:predicted nucleotidyltransferase
MPTTIPSTGEIRARLAALLPDLRERYTVRSLSIFGSYARGEQTAESDLDLLVEFDKTPDLYALGSMVLDVEDALGLRVDLFTRSTLKARMVPRVDRDLVAV